MNIFPLLISSTNTVGIVIIRDKVRINICIEYNIICYRITKTDCTSIEGYITSKGSCTTKSKISSNMNICKCSCYTDNISYDTNSNLSINCIKIICINSCYGRCSTNNISNDTSSDLNIF